MCSVFSWPEEIIDTHNEAQPAEAVLHFFLQPAALRTKPV